MNFGLVGLGNIGIRHAGLITKLGKLVSVCDIHPETVAQGTKQYGCKGFTSLQDMLTNVPEIEVIVVCSPNYLHAQHTLLALSKGKHVLCEKPMALNNEDCISMLKAAKENNRYLQVVKQNRFNPQVSFVKSLLDSNALGKVYSVSMQGFWNRPPDYYLQNGWRGNGDTDGGILFTQFSHFIDILIWYFGYAKVLDARGANLAHTQCSNFEDTILATLGLGDSILCSTHFSTCAYGSNMEGSLSILAEKGSLRIGGKYLDAMEYLRVEGGLEQNIAALSFGEGLPGAERPKEKNHESVYKVFMDAVLAGSPLDCSLTESMQTIQLIEEINKRVKQGAAT